MFEDLKNDQKNKVDDIFADSDTAEDNSPTSRPSFSRVQSNEVPRPTDDFINKKQLDSARFNDFEDSGSRSGKFLKRIFLVIIILAIIGVVAYFVYAKILVPRALGPDILNNKTNPSVNNVNEEKNTNDVANNNEIKDENIDTIVDNVISNNINSTTEENDSAIDLLKNLDSDNDGMSDYDEKYIYLTDSNNPDTDGDGLSDYEEAFVFGTYPLNPDSDGDGYLDGQEITAGYNPLGEGKINSSLFLDPASFQELYPSL